MSATNTEGAKAAEVAFGAKYQRRQPGGARLPADESAHGRLDVSATNTEGAEAAEAAFGAKYQCRQPGDARLPADESAHGRI